MNKLTSIPSFILCFLQIFFPVSSGGLADSMRFAADPSHSFLVLEDFLRC